MEGLRNFITMDNHEAVKIGDLEKAPESLPVVKPKFTTDLPEAMVREGADELTLRREETGMLRTFVDTTNVRDVDGSHRSRVRTGMPFVRRRRTRLGGHALQVLGDAQSGQRQESGGQQEGDGAVDTERG